MSTESKTDITNDLAVLAVLLALHYPDHYFTIRRAIDEIRGLRAKLGIPDPCFPCRADGRCQYAIDVSMEDVGHCPAGMCVMASSNE